MQKTLKFSAFALVGLTLLFSACKKNDEAVPTENPIASFLADSTTVISETSDNGSYEIAYAFKSSKAATLVQLGAHMPNAGTYQVTLWDAETKKSLVQANVVQSKDAESALVSIAKTAIVADKEYRLSIYTDGKSYYYIHPKSSEEVVVKAARVLDTKATAMFPIVKGNITISAVYYAQGKSVYPENNTSYLYGYPEFGIQF